MSTSLGCVIIARANRRQLIDDFILPSVKSTYLFREIVVVGEYHDGPGYRYLAVPPVTGTTLDALIKRECASAATDSDALLYLCDDHMLVNGWQTEWLALADQPWDILVPERVAERDGKLVTINNGLSPQDPHYPYVAGHAGIFRRRVLRARPWMAAPHDLYWDLGHSRQAMAAGFTVATTHDLRVCDIDPNPVERARHFVLAGGKPWETEG